MAVSVLTKASEVPDITVPKRRMAMAETSLDARDMRRRRGVR
jgi:hypothetical protein